MKTDKQIYTIFGINPEWLFELTGMESPGPCEMKSVAFKAIEKVADGVIFPVALEPPLTVAEFQFQFDPDIYCRIAIEMAQLQMRHSGREVQGMILFVDPSGDPKTEPWSQIIHAFYLGELLTGLEKRQPNHPLVAVFRPLLMENRATLEKEARDYYNQINESDLAEPSQKLLLNVFINWLEQRFSKKGKREIEEMLIGSLPDLRETQSGKDLIQIGWAEGKLEGKHEGEFEGKLKAKREVLIMLLKARFTQIDAQLLERIEQVNSIEQLDRLLLQVVSIGSIDQLKW